MVGGGMAGVVSGVDGSGRRKRGRRGGQKHRKAAEAAAGEMVSVKKEALGKLVNFMSSSWDGARESSRQGYVRLPNTNPEQAVTAGDRVTTAQKVRAGEQNVGLVKRFIEKPALLIGNQMPQANTGNDDFDKEVDECFLARAKYPEAFDAAGRFSFLDWQRWTRESKRRDGDCLSVLTEGAEGGGRLRCYEALQIGTGSWQGKAPKNLIDGVFLDRNGGRAGFQLLNPDGTRSVKVPRSRAIYHGSEVRVGRPRSVSSLAHGVANLTIDRGRDGVLDLQLLEKGKITDEEWWGRQGKDWKTEETKLFRQQLWKEEMEKREREEFAKRVR